MKETVECLICNRKFTQLSSHLKNKHNMTGDEYRNRFPGAPLMSELLIYNNSGKNGSNWQGGKIISICEQCGEEFDIFPYEKDTRRFCSAKCRVLWILEDKNKSIICDNCGEEFIRNILQIGEGKHFCSRECAKEGMIGEDAANWQGGEITLLCDWCGEEFDRHKSQISEGKIFCSQKCCGKWMSENLIGENAPMYNKKHTEKTKQKMRDNHPHLTGENSPHWKGGISPLRQLFMESKEYKKWHLSVFERDNYTCQECNNRGSVILHVHHILPYRDYPDLQYSLNIDNGITLCVDCHRKTFGKEYNFIVDYLGIIFDNKAINIFGGK